MSKTMKMIKIGLRLEGIKATNRNARKVLHFLRKLERRMEAEIKLTVSAPLGYRLPFDTEEEIDG